jgi:hypothetical protein
MVSSAGSGIGETSAESGTAAAERRLGLGFAILLSTSVVREAKLNERISPNVLTQERKKSKDSAGFT